MSLLLPRVDPRCVAICHCCPRLAVALERIAFPLLHPRWFHCCVFRCRPQGFCVCGYLHFLMYLSQCCRAGTVSFGFDSFSMPVTVRRARTMLSTSARTSCKISRRRSVVLRFWRRLRPCAVIHVHLLAR